MRKLNFFLDIDGTLLPFGKGLPQSAIETIEEASRMGHRFFLSTGRSTAEISSYLMEALPLKGGVFSAGCVVVYEGQKIYKKIFPKSEKDEILRYAEENNLAIFLQGEDGTYLTPKAGEMFTSFLTKYIGRVIDIPNFRVVDEFPEDLEIYKLLFISPDGLVPKVRKDFSMITDTFISDLILNLI